MTTVAIPWSHPIPDPLSLPPHALSVSPPSNTSNGSGNNDTAMLSHEDDWTRVKDPKEKKRIQNRVAQRTYRHRMKARLGELQARLDIHERKQQHAKQQQHPSPDNSDNCIDPSNITSSGQHAFQSHTTSESSSPSPTANDKPTTPQSIPMAHQASIYDQPTDDMDNMAYTHNPHLINSPHMSQHSQGNGLLSPPQPASEQGKAPPQDFVLDCLRFQSHLLTRLNGVNDMSTYPPGYNSQEGVAPHTISPHDPSIGSFVPAHPEGMEFTFEPHVDVWKQDPMMPKMHDTPPPTDIVSFPQMMTPSGNSMEPPMMASTPPVMPVPAQPPQQAPSSASMDERFAGILEHIQAAGFESFDAFVTAYYSDNFGDSSPLANEQRLSRNRRLPKVLADLYHAADSWTPWERRGFHEEILKTAESMLISESVVARNSLLTKLGPLIDSQENMGQPCSPDRINAMKRSIQNEIPNSWALAMALAADNRHSWQRDCSNTALATTLLLSFAGKVPTDQLLQLIGSCL